MEITLATGGNSNIQTNYCNVSAVIGDAENRAEET